MEPRESAPSYDELLATNEALLVRIAEMERTYEAFKVNVAEELAEARAQASTDALTGVGNRRGFDMMFAREWGRALRGKAPVALALLDLDHFKKYNDAYGHVAGDALLSVIGSALGSNFRTEDYVARVGGEEFAVVFPNTTAEQAQSALTALQEKVETLAVPHAQNPGGIVTFSAGIASMVPGLNTPSLSLYELADRALYEAKAAGRDQIRLAEIESEIEEEQENEVDSQDIGVDGVEETRDYAERDGEQTYEAPSLRDRHGREEIAAALVTVNAGQEPAARLAPVRRMRMQ